MKELNRTALYKIHRKENAKFVTFAGWEMPVQYTSVLDEAKAVRSSWGMFDVSHMGRVLVSGNNAMCDLDRLVTQDIAGLTIGQTRYGFLCNNRGGIIDDVTVTRLSEDKFLIVINAARREVDFEWIKANLSPDTKLIDQTFETAMIAVQGPNAVSLVDTVTNVDAVTNGDGKPSQLKRFRIGQFSISGITCQISRTGYTGEDGLEIICPAESGEIIWTILRNKGCQPCGLGARDILRLEAGFCLYGHDLKEDITPAEADLMRFVAMGKTFIGRDAISSQLVNGIKLKRVGLKLFTRAIARDGATVLFNNQPIGVVTSGIFSPHLNTAIAMAYVAINWAEIGNKVQVSIRDTLHEAEIVVMPFLRLPSKPTQSGSG